MNHEHNWVDVPVSFKGEVFGMEYQVSVKHCTICNLYDHTISLAGYAYEYFAMTAAPGVEGVIQNLAIKLYCSIFGENATATKFTPGGGSTSGGGVGRPKGYADDNGTANYNSSGVLQVVVNPIGFHWDSSSYKGSKFGLSLPVSVDVSGSQFGLTSNPKWALYAIYEFVAPCDGIFYLGREACGQTVFTSSLFYNSSWYTQNYNIPNYDGYGLSVSASKGQTLYYVSGALVCSIDAYPRTGAIKAEAYPLIILCEPLSSLTKLTNITINNNTWNGNIYTDNSTNLTYIYPQYTTINEKNETVTNISNTPIIYNNETKQYYTYDQTTKNYYYITYNAPSPSPTPAPTEKPGGSISTPETGKPGGDTGDTTGILAVLVEIRDNMIQGFLDIKAAFVAGFAELSANFTLAIENLNLNITNIFNKKFPDQSTPETAAPSPSPSPSPSPAPLDPILPETQNLIIPKMNSNTFSDEHGTWIATGSSKYSDVFDFFHAFDRSTSDFWETNASPSYLQIEIPDPENYYVDGYIMRISKFTNRYAKEWTLQGSDDGKTWDDLDTQKDQNLSDMQEHKYTLTLRKAYKYYRLNMSNYASSMCSLSHFNLLGYDAKDVVTPTPAPTDPPSPSPAPDPGKPDSGDKTNNFWTIIFPNGGGSEDGKKGIFWALVSLILALIAFFANLAVGVGYLFPFLPDGVVMTINTCLIVIFLFTIIKFIMRSK